MIKRLTRLSALIHKELLQVLRDRRTLAYIFVLPMVELFLFGYAIRLTVDHLPTVVADLSRDDQSRALLSALEESGYFDIQASAASEADVVGALDANLAKAGIVIPPNFAEQVARGDAQALLLLDGSDSFSVNSGYSAAVAVAQARALKLASEKADRMGVQLETTPITTSTRVLYNPDFRDLVFILPGLVALILQMLAVLTTAQSVVREYELGTIEQLMATPARPLELMVGKLIPNLLLMLLVLAITMLVGVFWFGVPFRGDAWLFAWLAFLFVWACLGLGLLISSVARTQREAQQITAMFSMLSMLLTGFIYPRANMPTVVKFIGSLIPLTYFVRIARGIVTKGIGLAFLWSDVIALAVYGTVILVFAALTTRKRLG